MESHCLGAPREEQELAGCPALLVTQQRKGSSDRSTRRASVGLNKPRATDPFEPTLGVS